MKRPSRTSTIMMALIVTLVLPVLTNVAASVLPAFLHPYLWIAWPLALLLALAVIASEVRRSHFEATHVRSAPQEEQLKQQAVADGASSVYQAGRDVVVMGELSHSPAQPQRPPAPPSEAEAWVRHAEVDHEQLFGVDSVLDRLGRLLANDNGDWIISIFGDGGAGKTTLAYEMVKRYAHPTGFERIAWVSAKFSHLRALGHIEENRRRAAVSWHDLLLDAARQLALEIDLNPARIEDRLASALLSLDWTDRCLIVIDNLETIADAERAVNFLDRSSVTRPHKVVITTRESAERLSSLVREVPWRGLQDSATRDFAQYLTIDEPNFKLSAEDLDQIVTTSGGIPLLVKMIVRLAIVEARTIADVVDRLKDPKGELGERVGLYLYVQAMDALAAKVGDLAATRLMNAFCGRASGESLTLEEFHELSLINDWSHFERARSAARDLALIRGLDSNSRFTVHPLLRQFVCITDD